MIYYKKSMDLVYRNGIILKMAKTGHQSEIKNHSKIVEKNGDFG